MNRDLSKRRNEIDDALRELEAEIGRGAHPNEVEHIVLRTRPAKNHTPADALVTAWRQRAAKHGLDADTLAAVTGHEPREQTLDADAILRGARRARRALRRGSVFSRSEALAAMVGHPDPQSLPLDARTILVVDEASTPSDHDLDTLMDMAVVTGASIRLIGDPAQHGAIAAGGMFASLCERHPTHTSELTNTRRLQDPHDRAAAQALREVRIDEAFDQLAAAGHLHVVADDLAMYRQILGRWWDAHAAAREWRATGGKAGIPCIEIGRTLRVPRADFERLLGRLA